MSSATQSVVSSSSSSSTLELVTNAYDGSQQRPTDSESVVVMVEGDPEISVLARPLGDLCALRNLRSTGLEHRYCFAEECEDLERNHLQRGDRKFVFILFDVTKVHTELGFYCYCLFLHLPGHC